MVLSSMQLQKVSVTLWFRRLQCLVLRSVLSDFINLRSAECVCSYYGLRVCSQTNKLNVKLASTLAEHGNTQLLLHTVVQNTQEWRKLLLYFSNLENS